MFPTPPPFPPFPWKISLADEEEKSHACFVATLERWLARVNFCCSSKGTKEP